MKIPTRAELIRTGKWKVQTVETEVGPIRVGMPAADAPMRIRALQLRGGADEQLEMTAEMLRSGCVGEDGEPLLGSIEEAKALLASITTSSVGKLLQAYTDMATPPKAGEEGAPGNSGAGPSAGSPSGSA